uniref:Uncharacterized protein n=1 Tax=Hippocampus comes TaxID=109280 RepID=A0A3Q2YYW7_HIPCM
MISIADGWLLRVEKKKASGYNHSAVRQWLDSSDKKEGTLVTPTCMHARMHICKKGTKSIITFPSIFCNSIGQAYRYTLLSFQSLSPGSRCRSNISRFKCIQYACQYNYVCLDVLLHRLCSDSSGPLYIYIYIFFLIYKILEECSLLCLSQWWTSTPQILFGCLG